MIEKAYSKIEGLFGGILIFLLVIGVLFLFSVQLAIWTMIICTSIAIGAGLVAMIATFLKQDKIPLETTPNMLFPVTSMEMFRTGNQEIRKAVLYTVSLQTVEYTSKKEREKQVTGEQESTPREPLSKRILKSPGAFYRFVQETVFGTARKIEEGAPVGPLENKNVHARESCYYLAYGIMFLLALTRFVFALFPVLVYDLSHFDTWSKKMDHRDHSYYWPAYRCACGLIHGELSPVATGAGAFTRMCRCGRTLNVWVPEKNADLTPICPVCREEISSPSS